MCDSTLLFYRYCGEKNHIKSSVQHLSVTHTAFTLLAFPQSQVHFLHVSTSFIPLTVKGVVLSAELRHLHR